MLEYNLTLNSSQAHEILKAVELLMRLKINQSFTFTDTVATWDVQCHNNLREARRYVELALGILFEGKDSSTWKDAEWYRLYNLYQVIRKAIHDAEHPDSPGVDSQEPIQFTSEPLPKIRWEKDNGESQCNNNQK